LAEVESAGRYKLPWTHKPLFILTLAVLVGICTGLNPTTSAEISSPLSVEKIGTAMT
jgi:hypothetical protein